MKILMFSADPTILDTDSAAAGRMKKYGAMVELMNILVLLPRLGARPKLVSLAPNVMAVGLPGKFSRFFKSFFKAQQMVKKEKYNLLVAQDIEHAFICWLLTWKPRFHLETGFPILPWQIQIHTDIFSPYFVGHSVSNRLRVWLAKFLITQASCVRVVSARIRDSLIVKCKAQNAKIEILPILVGSVNLNTEPRRFPEFDKTILMVSRLTSEKNIGLAIDAMVEVVKKYHKTGLIVVGDGPEREELELVARSHGLESNVRFEGWQKDVAPYYKGADIFLLTSLYEGWGMSVVEAMRYGAAVVMTDVGLAGELVEDGKSGLIVPVNDKNALVVAILRLLEDDNLRRNLAESAKKKAAELPSEDEYYQKMVDSWEKCVNS